MQEIASVTTAVCKSLQSIGLSPRKEHQIENALAIQLRSSGAEFVLSRISDLNDWRKMHMQGDTSYHPAWHAYRDRKGCCTPTDAIGSQIWGLSDKAFFATTGAISKAVVLAVPSEKQLSKWLDGVRCQRTTFKDRTLGAYASDRTLCRLEDTLVRLWKGRHWFDVSDITGTNIPGASKFMNVRVDRRSLEKDPRSLVDAYRFSVSTAPLFVWQFLKDISAPRRMAANVDDPDKLIDSLGQVIEAKLKDNILQDEAESGSFCISQEGFMKDQGRFFDFPFGFGGSVGNIGFLEQEKGKLRTVANPNRLVQYCNVPLGEAFSQLTYCQDGCYVLNQHAGIEWAQQKLRKGVKLSSFDMSSATDRLDYAAFIDDYFVLVKKNPDRYPLLARSLEFFMDCSQGLWAIPGHIADLVGSTVNQISWSVGQPLGLRPSFPLLTMMNMKFAEAAIRLVDGHLSRGHYACVGDDLIIESQYASAYMCVVRAYNGKINNDKTMSSDRYAEFCSQLVTRSTSYPLKPRFILETEGSLQNVERFTTRGLNPKVPSWVRELHDTLASYHLDGYDTIKYSSVGTPKSLLERLGVNTLIAAVNPASPDPKRVTLNTLFYQAYHSEGAPDSTLAVKDISSSSASSAYKKFGGPTANPTVNPHYASVQTTLTHNVGDVSTDASTSVEVPTKTSWDVRSNAYRKPTSEITQAKSLRKKIGKVSVSIDGDTVQATTTLKGVEHTVLIDTSSDHPEALIGTRKGTSRQAVSDITSDIPAKTQRIIGERRTKRRLPDNGEELLAEYERQHGCSDDFSL